MKVIPYLIVLHVSIVGFSSSVYAVDAIQEGTSPATDASPEKITTEATITETPAASALPTESATTTPATAQAELQDEQAGFSRGSVIRSIFTSAIQDREPIDKLDKSSEADRLFYFTELRDMSGQTAIHRWEFDGKVMAEVKFDVRGPRWRVWSSKSFVPGWAGDWKVSVLNGAGETISEELINMTAIPSEPATATTEAMPAATQADDITAPAETQPVTEEFQPPVSPELLQ